MAREAALLLDNDIALVEHSVRVALPWFEELDERRQDVLLNMAFNLGIAGLLKFRTTLGYVEAGRYEDAARSMLASKWARQVGDRAVRLAAIMRG